MDVVCIYVSVFIGLVVVIKLWINRWREEPNVTSIKKTSPPTIQLYSEHPQLFTDMLQAINNSDYENLTIMIRNPITVCYLLLKSNGVNDLTKLIRR